MWNSTLKQEYVLKAMIRITKLRELPLQNLVMNSFKKKSSLTNVLLRSMIHSFTTDNVRQVAQICAPLVVCRQLGVFYVWMNMSLCVMYCRFVLLLIAQGRSRRFVIIRFVNSKGIKRTIPIAGQR